MQLPVPDAPVADAALNHPASHGMALTGIFATMVGWLPTILLLLPAIYYCLLIFESKTVQAMLQRRRERKAARAVAKAQAKVVVAKQEVVIAKTVAETVADTTNDQSKSG